MRLSAMTLLCHEGEEISLPRSLWNFTFKPPPEDPSCLKHGPPGRSERSLIRYLFWNASPRLCCCTNRYECARPHIIGIRTFDLTGNSPDRERFTRNPCKSEMNAVDVVLNTLLVTQRDSSIAIENVIC